MDKKTYALITAAGTGTRMNMQQSKQYIEILGTPVLARSVAAFERCSSVDGIVVVVNKDDMEFCRENIIDRYGFKKVFAVTAGGSSRQQSVYNGLSVIEDKCDIVLIHDGARPFITEESIIGSIEAANTYGASCVAVRAKDTIKEEAGHGIAGNTLDRSRLWSVQTPQTFRYSLIMDAHMKAHKEGISVTDDSALVENMGLPVKLVEGSYFNIKITTVEDLVFAEAIAKYLKGCNE